MSTERDRRSTAFSGMSWMSQSASVSTASVSSVTPSADVRCTVQSVRCAEARAVTWTPLPLISYTSQPNASRPLPSPVTPMPYPEAWWIRQRSRRGWPPSRTETPDWPAETISHSSNTPPAPSSTAMPTLRRVVDRAPPHGGAGRAAHLDARGGPRHDPQVTQFRRAVLDQQSRGRRVLALDVEVLDDRGGAHGQRYAVGRSDPHGTDRPVGAAQRHRAVDHEVLPVRSGRDGEDVSVGRRLQGRGEGGVLARAAAPSRCAGVRHLDRALCHGVAVPPPRAVRCLGPVRRREADGVGPP